jgi:hypothetical protein
LILVADQRLLKVLRSAPVVYKFFHQTFSSLTDLVGVLSFGVYEVVRERVTMLIILVIAIVVPVPLFAIAWTLRGEAARYRPPREHKRRRRPF